MKKISFGFLAIFLFVSCFSSAMAWHDRTHIAVGVAAQFDQAYNLAGPDVAKLKVDTVEEYNHWVDNSETTTITKALIKGQIQKYNLGTEREKGGSPIRGHRCRCPGLSGRISGRQIRYVSPCLRRPLYRGPIHALAQY